MRVDLNSPVVGKKVVYSDRIAAVSQVLKNYKNHSVVLMAHQGRPGRKDFVSLKQHAKFLKVKFVPDLFGSKAVNAIKKMKKGDVILLENVRFFKEEFKSRKTKFVKNLVPLFDKYVNNAFSASLHKKQVSVLSFPKYLPAYKGELMKEEIKHLSKLKDRKAVYVLGGVKIEDVYPLMKYVLKKNVAIKIVIGSYLSLILEGKVKHPLTRKFNRLFRKYKVKFAVPLDYAVAVNGKRKNVSTDTKRRVLDIGDKTIKYYFKEIKNTHCIFIKGTMGVFEKKGFEKGSKAVLKAAYGSKFSVVAGGDTVAGIKMFKLNRNRYSYVSLSGGAMLAYLAGKKLPGVEILK